MSLLPRIALPTLAAALALSATTPAQAADVKRRGVQAEALLGGSLCVPSRADCKEASEISGSTGPSFGMGFTLGFRPIRALMLGAAYNVGWFNPDYVSEGIDIYKSAYQNSVFGVIRGIIPIWRIDLGLEIAPGWSRQAFKARDNVPVLEKQFSQGFALKTAPVIDFYITRSFFIGAKLDLIWNFHRQVCVESGGSRACETRDRSDQASVHQMIFGLHLGGTF